MPAVSRKTPLKKAILEIFSVQSRPLSVMETQEILTQNFSLSPNKTTLYRQMEKLCEEKILQLAINRKETQFFEMASTHAHFSCEQCGKISCIKQNFSVQILENFLKNQGFFINTWQISASGKCPQCR